MLIKRATTWEVIKYFDSFPGFFYGQLSTASDNIGISLLYTAWLISCWLRYSLHLAAIEEVNLAFRKYGLA